MSVIESDNLHYKGARNGCARMLKDDETPAWGSKGQAIGFTDRENMA